MARDNEGGTTRTQVIAAELSAEIAAAKYPVGARFATEPELQVRFEVGRHTVREALKLLTEQGLLGRRRKTGTFVLATSPVSPYVHSLRDLRGLLDFAKTTVLEVKHAGAVCSETKLLSGVDDIPDGCWQRVAGLRMVRGEKLPLCWSEILIPEQFSPPSDQLVASPMAIYELTMAHNGFRLEYVEQEVTASLLSPAMMSMLGVDSDPAALLVKRRYVAHTGETFEVSHNLYPANRFKIRSVIRQRA